MKLTFIVLAICCFFFLESNGDFLKCWIKSTSSKPATSTPTAAPTTTAPTTTTKAGPESPCDLWVGYYKQDNSPTVNGFSAGIAAYKSANNSTAYVARGFYGNWAKPGRVQLTNNTSNATGQIWVQYSDEEITHPQASDILLGSGEYLVVRDNCVCKWLTLAVAANHAGLVRTTEQGSSLDLPIARINDTLNRVSLGSVYLSRNNAYYTDPKTGNENSVNNPAEVLVCGSNQDMSTRPTLKFGNKACALWTKYTNTTQNWPATNGFSFGKDRNNKTAYIGRANYADIQFIGRINVDTTTPVVLLTDGEIASTSVIEYLVIPSNCNCSWVAYATAKGMVGLVRSIDYSYNFAIGLVDLTGGRYSISSVKTASSWQQWTTLTGGTDTDYKPSVLLVCETS